jgi:predicted O-methyltransferase YrrM
MIGVYVLLLVIAGLLGYIAQKARSCAGKVFEIHNEVRELRRYDLTELAREVHAGAVLLDLLDLKGPLPQLGGWAASADFLLEIVRHLHRNKPKTVVELGSGASTIVMARMLQRAERGHLYSLDHDPEYAERTRTLLADHGLSDWATVLDAPLEQYGSNGSSAPAQFYDLDRLPAREVDLLVIDGPPDVPGQLTRLPAGSALFPRLAPGGLAIADDTRRESGQETLRRWTEEFPEWSVHQSSGGKGYAVLQKPARPG